MTRSIRFYGLRAVGLLLVLLAAAGSALAQAGPINAGQSISGTLTAEAPLALYTFNGAAGDHVTAYVMGVTDGMRPTLSLLSPTQRQLTVSGGDLLPGADGSLAQITYRLQETGMHTLLVASATGTPGDFVLRLSAEASTISLNLAPDTPTSINIPAGAAPIQYSFNALPDAPLTLLITSDTPNFAFSAQVFDGEGQPIARLGGKAVQGSSLSIGPDSGLYAITIAGLRPDAQGAVTLLLFAGPANQPAMSPGTTSDPATATPVPFVTATPVPAAAPVGCQVLPQNNTRVNVRSGPGTAFPIFGTLDPGQPQQVLGQSVDGLWYVVDENGLEGWASGGVTLLQGDCTNLRLYESPPVPTPVPPTPQQQAAPPQAAGNPVITFTVDGMGSQTVFPGNCANVSWYTENIREVYYQGAGVPGVGSRQECPLSDTMYTLRVILQDGTETSRNVTILMSNPGPMITPPAFNP